MLLGTFDAGGEGGHRAGRGVFYRLRGNTLTISFGGFERVYFILRVIALDRESEDLLGELVAQIVDRQILVDQLPALRHPLAFRIFSNYLTFYMTTADNDDEERSLRIELMKTQIDKFRQEMRWEPYKAFAAIIAGTAAMAGIILGVAHLMR